MCCQAACVNVPCPSQLQANATTECAAQCPQGNGTAEETQQYAECQSECIESYFLSATTSAPSSSATGASDASATGQTEATTTGASSSGKFSITFNAHAQSRTNTHAGSSATRSSGTAAATATGNGAPDTLRMSTIGLGFLSLVAAGLAL